MLLRKLTLLALGISCLWISMRGYSQDIFGSGEWFDIGLAVNADNRPVLQEATIRTLDGNIVITNGPGSSVSYSDSDNLKIPDEVELAWKIKGETTIHKRLLKVRSQIPASVLEKLKIKRPIHHMIIEFFVINNNPQMRWHLSKLSETTNGAATDIAQSSNWQ